MGRCHNRVVICTLPSAGVQKWYSPHAGQSVNCKLATQQVHPLVSLVNGKFFSVKV